MSNKLLSVHLIVRDEAEHITRCLRSVQGIADELIVVDTGSTDGTADIARDFGAVVLFSTWEDDFAKARNMALSRSTTDWIFAIDADEEVVEGAERLRDCLKETKASALTVEVENRIGTRPWDCVTFHPIRIFRRGGPYDYRFHGRIHEQIVNKNKEGVPASEILPSPLKLIHDGYLPERLEQKQKIDRNLHILKKMIEESPDDPFHLYNLGVTYCQLRKLEQASEIFSIALQRTPLQAAYRPTLIRDWGKVGIELGRWEETAEFLRIERHRYVDYPDLHHLLGDALAGAGELQEAYKAYHRAVECGKTARAYVTEAGMGTFRTYRALARIARKMGCLQQASEWYATCAVNYPHYEPALEEWADTLQELGLSDKTIFERLCAAITAGYGDNRFLLARLLIRIGAYAEALRLLKNASFPGSEEQELYWECLMQTGQFREAFEVMEPLHPHTVNRKRCWTLDWALCRWSEELDLPYRFYKHLSPDEQRAFEWLDCQLQDRAAEKTVPDDPAILSLIPELIERALKRKMTSIADRLSRLGPSYHLLLVKLLYRHGFVLMAADRLLTLMKDGTLDAEGLYMLGEIVYDKGHYDHAAALFEDVLNRLPEHGRARIGVSLSYLRMAHNLLMQSMEKAPNHPSFGYDLQRIETSIRLLEATGWHTSWSAAERRNNYVTSEDLTVHDR